MVTPPIKFTSNIVQPWTHWFFYGDTGCHREGQLLLMADGSEQAVEDIAIGDRVMGPDGPRTVKDLIRGIGPMVRVVPIKGEPFVVSRDHVLTVVSSKTHEVFDVPIEEYLKWAPTTKQQACLLQCDAVVWENEEPDSALPIDPYFLGVLLGDGSLRGGSSSVAVTTADPEIVEATHAFAKSWELTVVKVELPDNAADTYRLTSIYRLNPLRQALRKLGLVPTSSATKFVPTQYLYASRAARAALLAGLLDTDGSYSGGMFDFSSKSPQLKDAVVFLARSLGLRARAAEYTARLNGKDCGQHWRVSINGDLPRIPTRIARKQAAPRKQIKDWHRVGFTVEPLLVDEPYYGIVVDGDGRYLLGDFIITHNSGKTSCAATFPDPFFIVPTDENSVITLMDRHFPYLEVYGQKGSPRTQGWGLDAAVNWLEAELKRLGPDFPYMTVVVEAVSHYLEQVQEELTDGNKSQMDQRKWGALASHLRNIHSRLRNMAVHVVFTALVKEDQDAANNATASPLMSGKMGYLLPSACDVIGYCVAEPGNPMRFDVHFAKHKHFRARTRFKNMPKKITNFRFDDVEQYFVRPEVAKAAE